MIVRPHYLETVEKFEPFTHMLKVGATVADIKEFVIEVLNPYVTDKDLLREQAVSSLANEALCLANLNLRPEWKRLLDLSFEIRNSAISKNKGLAFKVICDFEAHIREAQKKYSMQILFEQSKEDLNTEEYAFEIFRLIGGLIESTIQPFIKEMYCFAVINIGQTPDTESTIKADFGKVVDQFASLGSFPELLIPGHWSVRINQWRNIAQHHSFAVNGEKIIAVYGKGLPQKSIEVTREELFWLSKELVRRLGALKSSRELTILNNIEALRHLLPPHEVDAYSIATELAASFATQGFTLKKLEEVNDTILASFFDTKPMDGHIRQIHCSQFVLLIGARFPRRNVNVSYESSTSTDKYLFSLSAEAYEILSKIDEPLTTLAQLLVWKKL